MGWEGEEELRDEGDEGGMEGEMLVGKGGAVRAHEESKGNRQGGRRRRRRREGGSAEEMEQEEEDVGAVEEFERRREGPVRFVEPYALGSPNAWAIAAKGDKDDWQGEMF